MPIEISTWDWELKETTADTKEERASLLAAVTAAQAWLLDIWHNQQPRWLLLCGVSGNGKTHIALRAAAWLRKYGERCYNKHRKDIDPMLANPEAIYSYRQERPVFVRWDHDLLKPAKGGDYYHLRRAEEDWFKIVDEFGSEQKERGPDGALRPTAFAQGTLTSLIEGRMRRWMLATSNLTRSDFSKVYDPRVADRFMRWPNVIVEMRLRSYSLRMEEACKKKTQR